MLQLTPMDATFLYLENESTHAHATLVWIYDASDCDLSTINRRALLDHMRSRLHVSHLFTRKIHRLPLDFDYPYWVDDPGFELLYHVRELSMPEQGTWQDFCHLVATTHSEPLNHDHPLWEMTLVRGLDGISGLPQQCFAILGKFHHVSLDGATGMQIVAGIHDSTDEDSTVPQSPIRPVRKPELSESLFRAGVRSIGALDKSLSLLGLGRVNAQNKGEEESTAIEKPIEADTNEPPIPQTVFNQAIGGESAWDSRSFNLAEIKTIRDAVKPATVNDVLLAVVGGGLRHYLESVDALPETSMKAGCPVNIRTESEASSGGNMISAIIVSMHTDVTDPMQRLRAIARSSTAAKQRASRRGSRKILDIASVVPAQAQALLGQLVGKVSGKLNRAVMFNGSVSNLPGPQQELFMLGARLQSIGAAMPVMNGYGLFIGLTTCAGELRISMSSTSNILPDPERLGDCMEQSYKELKNAALKSTKRRKQSRKLS